MNVVDVPGYDITSNELTSTYVSELKLVDSVDALENFIEKWKAVWLVPVSRYPEDVEELRKKVGEKDFDMEVALQCIGDSREKENGCIHVKVELCAGTQIVMPPMLLDATILSQSFGMPDFAALHQGFCIDPDHKGCF